MKRVKTARGFLCAGVIEMLIGVPKEIKNHEYRVGLCPRPCASSCITAIR